MLCLQPTTTKSNVFCLYVLVEIKLELLEQQQIILEHVLTPCFGTIQIIYHRYYQLGKDFYDYYSTVVH